MSLKLYRGTLANLPASLAEGEIAWVTDSPNQAIYVGNSTGNIKFSPASAGAAGDVVGPGSSTTDNIATFADTSGKSIKDSTVAVADIGLNSAHRAVVTGNPHAVTFTEAVTADSLTDITAAEAETLTDGSDADSLHTHSSFDDVEADWIDFENVSFGTGNWPARVEGRLWYDPDNLSLNLYPAGTEVTHQIGHELLGTVPNNSGVNILNGEVITLTAAGDVEKAIASDKDSALGVGGLATELIEDGTIGMVTVVGVVNDVDTSSWPVNTVLYLSDTVAGALTDTMPNSPSWAIRIGIVIISHATTGAIYVRIHDAGNVQGAHRLVNGSCVEGYSTTITSDGTVVTCTMNSDDGNDLSLIFEEEIQVYSQPGSVSLTPGTDATPALNYVFIPESTMTLTANTTGFPSSEDYQPVGQFFCQSAASVLTDSILKHHAWNDHLGNVALNGHLSHLNFWIRNQHSTWLTGCAPSITDGANTYFDVTAGTALQLHVNPCNALAMSTGHPVYIVNDSVTTYKRETDLNNVILDSAGVTLNNKYFKLVFLEIVNSDGDGQVLVNLPSGSYNSQANAESDISGYADFSLPAQFKGVGFLVASCVLRLSGGTQTEYGILDLRGAMIGTISGGSTGGTGGGTVFPDSTFRVQNITDPTKELSFLLSGVTTGNVRVMTVPDADGTLALTSDLQAAHTNRTELDKVTVGDHDVIVTGNPHAVTATEVGLGNVDNVATDDTPYDATTWNANTDAATKNAIRDEVELIWTDVDLNTTHAGSDGKDHSDVVLNNAHRVVVTGNPHAVTKTEVGLANVTNDKQVRNAASSFATDFTNGTPISTHKILVESAAGSMRYAYASALPVSTATQTAIDLKGSGTKRRMIFIETMTASDSYPICMVPVACTITEVTAQTLNGTFTYNLQERAKGAPGTGSTTVFSSAKLGYSTLSTETSFSNDSLAAETWLYFVAATVSSTPPTHSWVTVEYTED